MIHKVRFIHCVTLVDFVTPSDARDEYLTVDDEGDDWDGDDQVTDGEWRQDEVRCSSQLSVFLHGPQEEAVADHAAQDDDLKENFRGVQLFVENEFHGIYDQFSI